MPARNYEPTKVPAENIRLTFADTVDAGATASQYVTPATTEEAIARTLANINQLAQDGQSGLTPDVQAAINAAQAAAEAASQPLDADLTAYADAADSAARRELFVAQGYEVNSANFTAKVATRHTVLATATVTDPTPSAGAWFEVFVRNGTATVGGTPYATAGTLVRRVWHSGSWVNYSNQVTSADITDSTATGRAVLTAASQSAGRDGLGATAGVFPASFSAAWQAETSDYHARVLAAGGSVDASTLAAVDKFIATGKRDGWWSAGKDAWFPFGDYTGSQIKLIKGGGAEMTRFNFTSADYSQDTGYGVPFANGTLQKYLSTGFIPNNNGVTSQNITLAVVTCTTPSSGGNNGFIVGGTPSGSVNALPFFDPGFMGPVYSGVSHPNSVSPLVAGFTASASGWASFLHGTKGATFTSPVSQTYAHEIELFRAKRIDGVVYYSASTSISGYFIGTVITDAQMISLTRAMYELNRVARLIQVRPIMGVIGDSISMGQGTNGPLNYTSRLASQMGWLPLNVSVAGSTLNSAGNNPGINRYVDFLKNDMSVLVIGYGTNEKRSLDGATNGTQSIANTYRDNLVTVANAATAKGMRVLIVSTSWDSASNATKSGMYVKAAADAAITAGVDFADTFSVINNAASPSSYFDDGVHPNASGTAIWAAQCVRALRGQLYNLASLDFPSIAAGGTQSLTVTVYGARAGMPVDVTPPSAVATAGLVMPPPTVTADDTVTITLYNPTGGAVDLSAAYFAVTVRRALP